MPLLFSYGALRDEKLRYEVFGRQVEGQPDCLERFDLTDLEVEFPGGQLYPNIVYGGRNDSRVKGVVFDISESELAAADTFGQHAGYKREPQQLASGRMAWVYIYTGA